MRRFLAISLLLVAAFGPVSASDGEAFAKGKPASWKLIDDALLRVNDVAVKDWNVYQAGKKRDPLLLQIGNRFLLIEVREESVFEIDPSKIERKSGEVLWDASGRAAQPLATSEWVATDLGAAFRISIKMSMENRVLDLELPHPPNLGDLPIGSPSPRRK